ALEGNKDNGGFELKENCFGHAFASIVADLHMLNAGVPPQMGLPYTCFSSTGCGFALAKSRCPDSCTCFSPVNHRFASANHR
ncbi:hypothetical protein HAX54_022646, partial [Datura stramonium]|nr:hypothetical protein [Datura stramonium]